MVFFWEDNERLSTTSHLGSLITKDRAPNVDNKKLVCVHDREIISTTSENRENRAASFSSINGDGFILYWWQSPDFLTPPAVKVCLVRQTRLLPGRLYHAESERRPHNGYIETRNYRAFLHLEHLDIWIKQLINVEGKSLYVRLRNEIHDHRRQLVIDADVIDTLPQH